MVHIPPKQITDQRNYYPADMSLMTTLNGHSNRSDTGESVTKESVLGQPSWYRGVKLIANTLAKVPKPLFKHLPDDGREKDREHIVYELLNGMANPFTTSFQFFQAFGADLCYGNAVGIIERDFSFDPVALHNVDNRAVFPTFEYEEGRLVGLYYAVNTTNGPIVFPSQDILHVRDLALGDGTEGVDVVSTMKNNFGLGSAITKYGCIYFKHGSHINKVLRIPQWLTPEQKEELKTQVQAWHEGLANSHKMLTLFGNAELESLPINNEEAQWSEAQNNSNRDKAVVLGLPGNKIGIRDSASYGSLAEENLAVLSDTYDAIFSNVENELSAKLLTRQERKTHYIEFNRKAIHQANPELQDALEEKQFLSGRRSFEETRQLSNMPTKRKGTYVLPSNVVAWDAPDSQHPEPPPAPVPPAPVAEIDPAKDQNETQEVNMEVTRSDSLDKSVKLTTNVLERLKRRFAKSGQIEIAAIEESLEGLDTALVLESLDSFRQEFEAVLPEQRPEVLSKWDTTELAVKLWS